MIPSYRHALDYELSSAVITCIRLANVMPVNIPSVRVDGVFLLKWRERGLGGF